MVPVRHHSPACAAHLERLLAAVRPAAILVEGPCDFDPLIEVLCDERTRAPVAIVALNDGGESGAEQRVASYFPVCAHSPELIALKAARSMGLPARFIDLPSSSRVMAAEPEAPREGRSLLGSERAFDVGDYVLALARELGVRDGNEAWDQLFETRLCDDDWQQFFADVARYCSCIRAASSVADMEADGTLAREAQMRAIVAEVRRDVDGPIIAVVGGFHAEALLGESDSKPALAPARSGAGRSYLIRYGMRQLDALRGYGAGLPLPGFYQRLWQARDGGLEGLAADLIQGFAAHLREGKGEAPSFPVIANAIEQAHRLASLRGRPFAMRDDIVDAIRSSFIKDEIPIEQVPLLNELKAWLTGTALGDVPPGTASPPLVEAVRAQAKRLGFAVEDGERRSRHLDIYRKPRHREASRFCHAMTLVGTGFADRTGGPDFRHDVSLDRLHEIWSVGWSPMVEARLIELSGIADTLDEALAHRLSEMIAALQGQGKSRNALAAIDLFAAACRAGLMDVGTEILGLIEQQVIEDPEPGSLVAALTDLLLLRRGRETLGLRDCGPIDRLIGAAWRRLLLLLPEMAEWGNEQVRPAVDALCGLRGAVELAASSGAAIDRAALDEALDALASRRLPPMLAGAVMAFALLDGRIDVAALESRLSGELAGGYVEPADRLAFLGGVIAMARELLWTMPQITDALDAIIGALDDEEFVAMLPHLRLALMPLDPREIDRLADEVAQRIGVPMAALTAHVRISEGEMQRNLDMDRALASVLARDGVA